MPKVGPDEIQINYVLKRDLDERVQEYWHQQKLPSKAEAYRRLIELGLEAAKSQAPESK